MAATNHRRRAAKAQRRARRRERRGPTGFGPSGDHRPGGGGESFGAGFHSAFGSHTSDRLAIVDLQVHSTVRRLMRRSRSAEALHEAALALRSGVSVSPHHLLVSAVLDLLDRLVVPVLEYWTPEDLAELVRRECGAHTLPALAELLRRAGGISGLAADGRWRAQVDALGTPRRLDLSTDEGLAEALHMAAVLGLAPAGEPGRATPRRPATPAASPQDTRRLATVRALLAKAESTPYDEEAEALTAKAQELVTRYALERLLAGGTQEAASGAGLEVRRIWIDPPYPDAKSSLVHQVAQANRCRAVYAQSLSVCTVIGDPADVAAVELLVTSLLVQASRAMLRHGSQYDRAGMSRTRSFRRSFLTSFAVRIGQRLSAATQHEVDTAEHRADLLPALRTHSEHVDEMLQEMFPHLIERETAVTNPAGWAAGRVAADLAALDAHSGLDGAPAPEPPLPRASLW